MRWLHLFSESSLVAFAKRMAEETCCWLCSISALLFRISSSSWWRHSHSRESNWSTRLICACISSERPLKLPLSSASRRSNLGCRASMLLIFWSTRAKAASRNRSLCCWTLEIWLLSFSSSASICLRTAVRMALSWAARATPRFILVLLGVDPARVAASSRMRCTAPPAAGRGLARRPCAAATADSLSATAVLVVSVPATASAATAGTAGACASEAAAASPCWWLFISKARA
mmetsp:Transcript_40046/g.127433  ORF Transcript_40046/g.127433 Transcript_40046/m.127433 type:complete len:232 (+) Transcript_40046:1191-1886(+)